jgi:hypothetical protein
MISLYLHLPGKIFLAIIDYFQNDNHCTLRTLLQIVKEFTRRYRRCIILLRIPGIDGKIQPYLVKGTESPDTVEKAGCFADILTVWWCN